MEQITPVKVKLCDVRDDDTFRVSRPVVTDTLIQSVRDLGMLERPFLLDDSGGLIPFTCHNRILSLRKLEADKVDAFIIKQIDPAIFINNTSLKVRRNETGPAGKCRAFLLAQKHNLYPDTAQFCKKIINVSPDILDAQLASAVLGLPRQVRNYVDVKDTGFKILRDLVALPEYMISWIAYCLDEMQVRANVFRMVVDYLFDLGGKNDRVLLPFIDEGMRDDRQLLEVLGRLRYPEYSRLRDQADKLLSSLSSRGVSVDFPEFFESSRFVVNFDVSVRDSVNDIRERLDRIDAAGLVKLASLLK